ncbi:MAG: protein-L-isoaspartate(D-aspartate) O-methyltransferase [Planctomycetes bacterium]|nr:protein-L-isoaspartate(D-aspartate) O-methyltransferase [Planctomycetota bacterium]
MVAEQLRRRGIKDERVLDVMSQVPREMFVPIKLRSSAYQDCPLAIGEGQTISQPFIVAYMTEKLMPTSLCRVLEVGTGTGYQTAVLALLCKTVYSIERLESLHQQARQLLDRLNLLNAVLCLGDGSVGLEEHAPFDRILVTAAAPHVPRPLVDQLIDGGRLVAPVGGPNEQTIVCVDRRGSKIIETQTLGCRFVKLIGEEGWANDC